MNPKAIGWLLLFFVISASAFAAPSKSYLEKKVAAITSSELISAPLVVIGQVNSSIAVDESTIKEGKSLSIPFHVLTNLKGTTPTHIDVNIRSQDADLFSSFLGLCGFGKNIKVLVLLEENEGKYFFLRNLPFWVFCPVTTAGNGELDKTATEILSISNYEACRNELSRQLSNSLNESSLPTSAPGRIPIIAETFQNLYLYQLIASTAGSQSDYSAAIASKIRSQYTAQTPSLPVIAHQLIKNASSTGFASLLGLLQEPDLSLKQKEQIKVLANAVLMKIPSADAVNYLSVIETLDSPMLLATALMKASDDPKQIPLATYLRLFRSSDDVHVRYQILARLKALGLQGSPPLPSLTAFVRDSEPTIQDWNNFLGTYVP
jgi:hypothetical protein